MVHQPAGMIFHPRDREQKTTEIYGTKKSAGEEGKKSGGHSSAESPEEVDKETPLSTEP